MTKKILPVLALLVFVLTACAPAIAETTQQADYVPEGHAVAVVEDSNSNEYYRVVSTSDAGVSEYQYLSCESGGCVPNSVRYGIEGYGGCLAVGSKDGSKMVDLDECGPFFDGSKPLESSLPDSGQQRWFDEVGIKNLGPNPSDTTTNGWWDWEGFLAAMQATSRSDKVLIYGVFAPEEGNLTTDYMYEKGYELGLPPYDAYDNPNAPHAISFFVTMNMRGEITRICFDTWNASWMSVEDHKGVDGLFFKAFPNYEKDGKKSRQGLIDLVDLIVNAAEAK